MTVTHADIAVPLLPRITSDVERSVVLHGVSWALYEQLLDVVGDGHLRLTYDEGSLEIMSPSGLHEHVKTILGRVIESYSDEMDIPVQGYGSTTFRRRGLKKGLEPDECYYIQHFDKIVGKGNLDLRKDPAPDLAVEIDISSRSIPRQPIYAALKVAEVWLFDGRDVRSLHRTRQGAYAEAPHSLAFPKLPMKIVSRLVPIELSKGQPAAVKALREWIRTGKLPE